MAGAVALVIAGGITWGQARPRARRMVRNPTAAAKLFEGSPPRHMGQYPAFNVAWQMEERVRDVTGVFPHPLMSRRCIAATGAGLVMTDDWGKIWKDIAGTADLGEVRHVEFSLDGSDLMYVATAANGVWRIDSLGKAPVQIGTKAAGMVADAVAQVRLDPADSQLKTLVAAHGGDAAGLSRSEDGGKTWKPVPGMEEYFVDKIICGGRGVSWAFMLASQGDASGPRRIFFCRTIGDFLIDYGGDVQATDGANEILFEKPFQEASDIGYFATRGSGIIQTEHQGTNSERIGPEEADKWNSVGVTYGATADARLIYGYEPAKLGMAVSQDNGKSFAGFSTGLPSGGFVKRGAQVRANAGGSIFYAAINNALYVGRRHTGAVAISEVETWPSAVTYSSREYEVAFNAFHTEVGEFRGDKRPGIAAQEAMQKYEALKKATTDVTFAVTARIGGGDEDEKAELASLTVDLSRVGGSAAAPMFDDGLHGDGEAGDGVYGAMCMLRPDRLRNFYQDRRRQLPGPAAITITAISADGNLSSAVAVISLAERLESHLYWTPTVRDRWNELEGGIRVSLDDLPGPGDKKALKIVTREKAWSLPLMNYYDRNVVGYYALSFEVKTDGAKGKEFYVQLMDASPDTASVSTGKVAVVKEGLVDGGAIGSEYRRVVVPFERVLREAPANGARFRPTMLQAVVIGGDGDGQTYWIKDVHFHAKAEEVGHRVIRGKLR